MTAYLIFDDSVHITPKGRKMGDQGRRYASTEQLIVKWRNLVAGPYLLLDRCCPLSAEMYGQTDRLPAVFPGGTARVGSGAGAVVRQYPAPFF